MDDKKPKFWPAILGGAVGGLIGCAVAFVIYKLVGESGKFIGTLFAASFIGFCIGATSKTWRQAMHGLKFGLLGCIVGYLVAQSLMKPIVKLIPEWITNTIAAANGINLDKEVPFLIGVTSMHTIMPMIIGGSICMMLGLTIFGAVISLGVGIALKSRTQAILGAIFGFVSMATIGFIGLSIWGFQGRIIGRVHSEIVLVLAITIIGAIIGLSVSLSQIVAYKIEKRKATDRFPLSQE